MTLITPYFTHICGLDCKTSKSTRNTCKKQYNIHAQTPDPSQLTFISLPNNTKAQEFISQENNQSSSS